MMTRGGNHCRGTCQHLSGISRRDFIKVAAVAGLGLLTACTSTPSEISTEESSTAQYIAYCGTSYCLRCPEYKSTCAGCLAGEEEKVNDAAANCAVRICSRERNLVNCAYCEEYSCNKLEELYARYGGMVDARAKLDEVHKALP